MSTDVHNRMVVQLNATSAVTDILGAGAAARIRPGRLTQGETLPAIVYSQVGGHRENVTTGTSTTAESRFRLWCIAASWDAAHTLSAAVEGALSGWNDRSGSGVWHLDSGPHDGPSETPEGQDAAEFAVIQDYLVWHSTT